MKAISIKQPWASLIAHSIKKIENMKKIMFNDKYGLTQAVLEGRKTQTRRIARVSKHTFELLSGLFPEAPKELIQSVFKSNSRYDVDEIVAVAQSYKDVGFRPDKILYRSIPSIDGYKQETAASQKGWSNKMYVAANLMPHQILITKVRIQRLQDISDEDCLAEGITCINNKKNIFGYNGMYEIPNGFNVYNTPREAYAVLIDEVGKKGDWDSNPYVFVYDFELLK